MRIDAILRQLGLDVVFRKVRQRDIELVAEVTPEGARDFLIELFLLLGLQELSCVFQPLDSRFVCLLRADAGQVCILFDLFPIRKDERRQMVIAAVPDAAGFFLKTLVDYYTRIYPGTEISVLERSREEAAELLADASVDAAITDTPVEGADSAVFATLSIGGSSRPMATWYINRTAGAETGSTIDDFLLCCRTFK